MIASLHADGIVIVNDAGSIAVVRAAGQGAWNVDPDPRALQLAGKDRYEATFMGFQGTPGFGRVRLVTYWDPNDPNRMIGYMQPYFFPIAVPDFLVPLPLGCDNTFGCLGTQYFTFVRVKAN